MEITIAGGGIGGLTLALALNARGIGVRVFEQAPAFRELGVGINTLPHAIRALSALGLLDALCATGIETAELIYKLADGRDILRQPRGVAAGYGVPQFSIHRGKLHGLLRDAVIDRMPGALMPGHRLTGFDQDADGVTATFATADGGISVASDALIGADGIHSTVRRTYYPETGDPSWNGILMWRGAAWWPPFLTGRSMIIAGGMRAKLVLYPIHADPGRPGEVLMNWVVCIKMGDETTPLPTRDDWSREAPHEEVLAHVRGVFSLPECDVEGLIRATEKIYVYPMCDRDPLPRWSHGRVTLLGDAAHPMYPVGSNGASQAILDAVALADLLKAHPANEALAAYDDARRPATSAIVLANRKGGPERVIDLVEARAPDGFADLHQIATPEELTAIVGDYQKMAGFAADQVNRPA